MCFCTFFFNDTATTEIYTLSLHDALPIWTTLRNVSMETGRSTNHSPELMELLRKLIIPEFPYGPAGFQERLHELRSEEHTSELQSRQYLVCRLLLEKKTTKPILRQLLSQP